MTPDRIHHLQARMRAEGIDAFYIKSGDYHGSEYAAPYFNVIEFYTGFTGENATLIVQRGSADLWVDGRFFIQADNETAGTEVTVQRMGEPGVPTAHAFLASHLQEHGVLAFDGRCISMNEGRQLQGLLADVMIASEIDPAQGIWNDRPAMPCTQLWILDAERYAGESTGSKRGRLRAAMQEKGATTFVSGRLDEIMWLYNLRANDVECNPVALSYTIVTMDEATLYVQPAALTDEVRAYCKANGITLADYQDYADDLAALPRNEAVMLDPDAANYATWRALEDEDLILTVSPLTLMKAVKNETEIRNFKDCYIEDSAALTKFIYWLQQEVPRRAAAGEEPLTECTAADYLDHLRSEIQDYVELSFGTISAYGPNAAMMHYSPDRDHCATLEPRDMLLVDSGGHYLRGTTDVTRTMALGPISQDMRRSYTLTAVSQLALANLHFLAGCSGIALDAIAREPMWRNGMDYKCGTGHGIGYLLNVHEGPQTIRYRAREEGDNTPFAPGMVVSDEPGVYKAGEYGIRIETILLCVEKETTADGTFYGFEPLTFVPLDPALIDPAYLTPDARVWLNEYHAEVYEKIAPFMNEEEKIWLAEQCKAV